MKENTDKMSGLCRVFNRLKGAVSTPSAFSLLLPERKTVNNRADSFKPCLNAPVTEMKVYEIRPD